jgi:vancomycin resistance protein VanJ
MSRTDRLGDSPTFWRCRHCGTQNPKASYLTQCLGCGAGRPEPVAVRAGWPERPRRRGRSRRVASACGVYAALVLGALLLVRWQGDLWWPATLALFLPRWVFLLPAPALTLAAFWARRPVLGAAPAATALVVAGPLMGLSGPIEWLWAPAPAGPRYRIMTFNRGNAGLDAVGLIRLIDRERIDLICFQEVGQNPVLDRFLARGWHLNADRTIASRWPMIADRGPSHHADGAYWHWAVHTSRVRVRAPAGPTLDVCSVHMPTLRHGLRRLWAGDLAGFRGHIAWRQEQMSRLIGDVIPAEDVPMLVGGDFNTPADSPLLGSLHRIFQSGFERAGWGYGYTCPTPLPWARIDQVLASPEWTVTRCWVGPTLGSDHRPVIAEVALTAPPPVGTSP